MPSPRFDAGPVVNGDRAEILAAGVAAVAHLQVALDAGVEEVVRRVEEETGERILVRRPGVLDAHWPDLQRMSWQASNFEAAMRLVQPLMQAAGDRSLGAVLKTVGPVLLRDVTRHLVEAGVLPVEDGSG